MHVPTHFLSNNQTHCSVLLTVFALCTSDTMIIFIFYTFLLSYQPLMTNAGHCTTITPQRTYQKCMNLPTQEASIAWTFYPHNATLDFVFFGTFISPTGWVGCGINPSSPEMTGTRALIGFPDPNSGQIVLLTYILDAAVKLQKSPLVSTPLDIRQLISSSVILYGGRMATIHDGAALRIFATFKLVPNKTRINLVWNRGLYVQGYSPTIHPTTTNDLSSAISLDLLSGVAASTNYNNIETLKLVHATLNAVSWGVLLPVGAVAARYLRHIQVVGVVWFYSHAGIQITAFLLGTCGFAIGIQLGDMSPGVTYSLHRNLGVAAFCLAGLQTLALLFRPKTTHKFRKYWKSYHHFVGYACVVLGVVNVFQGFEVMGISGSYAKLAYCLTLSTIIGVCIALEVNGWVIFCRKCKEDKMRREGLVGSYEKGNLDDN